MPGKRSLPPRPKRDDFKTNAEYLKARDDRRDDRGEPGLTFKEVGERAWQLYKDCKADRLIDALLQIAKDRGEEPDLDRIAAQVEKIVDGPESYETWYARRWNMARGRRKDVINRQWRIDQAVLSGQPTWAPRRSPKTGELVPVLPSWLLPGWPEHLEIPEHPPLAPPIPNGRPPRLFKSASSVSPPMPIASDLPVAPTAATPTTTATIVTNYANPAT